MVGAAVATTGAVVDAVAESIVGEGAVVVLVTSGAGTAGTMVVGPAVGPGAVDATVEGTVEGVVDVVAGQYWTWRRTCWG